MQCVTQCVINQVTRFAPTSRAQQILHRHKEEEQYQVANARIASQISPVTNWAVLVYAAHFEPYAARTRICGAYACVRGKKLPSCRRAVAGRPG